MAQRTGHRSTSERSRRVDRRGQVNCAQAARLISLFWDEWAMPATRAATPAARHVVSRSHDE